MSKTTVYLISILIALLGLAVGALLSGHVVSPRMLALTIVVAIILTWGWLRTKGR